jgi:YD repeat-containing protein
MELSRFVRVSLLALVAVLPSALYAAGTGPVVWRITQNIGGCGSYGTDIPDFPSFGEAKDAQLAAMAAQSCVYAQPTVIGSFPTYDVKASADPQENTSFTVSAACKGGNPLYFAPDANGVCNYTTGPNPDKAAGCQGCTRGNPASLEGGAKMQRYVDYHGPGPFPLRFARVYNSTVVRGTAIGVRWTHSYAAKVVHFADTPNVVTVFRGDGASRSFRSADGQSFTADPDVSDRITQQRNGSGQITGWLYYDASSESTEQYDAAGKLLSIASREGLVQALTYSDGTAAGGFIEGTSTALPAGLLTKVADPFGRTLLFGYDAARRIVRLTDPASANYAYAYDARGNLASVTDPEGKVRANHYAESSFVISPGSSDFYFSLTGITDENGARHSNYAYYDGRGRAGMSEHVAGAATVLKHQWSWHDNLAEMDETDPLGQVRRYNNQLLHGIAKTTSIAGSPCPSCGPASQAYDANGNPASRTDWNGNRTSYTYDLARNLETQRVEGLTSAGASTPQTRTISTQWHADYRLPTVVAEPLRITTNVYGSPTDTNPGNRGNLLSRTVQATSDANGSQGFSATPVGSARTWTYTYNANGSVLTVDGPRTDVSDVTTYTYYANNDADLGKRGNVATITNAAGHVTQITAYNAHGQPLTIVDANGLTTTLTYDSRLRLKTRTVGSELTSYDYDGVGQLTKVTLPDGSFLSYTYDSAHRLTGIEDNLGHRIAYTLDAMGNRTKEEVFDPLNTLAQTRSRVYSSLNRLFQELGATNQTTEYGYDNQGNVTSVKDPLNRTTANQYDALNRLKQVTDPNLGVTQYGYNGLDALTQVTDPRSLATAYTVDGLENLTQQASPDTGTTASTYDAAGNLLTQTDAKSQVTTYAYDALNRVTLITFHDGSKQAYAYDQGANGLGRLSSITETNAANQQTSLIQYAYDAHGRVVSETRTLAGVAYVMGYSYDSSGRLSGLTYPSGRTVSYTFDALGRVSQVSTTENGQAQVAVQNVTYHPFGGVKGFTLGNGQIYSRTIDLDGRIAAYTLGGTGYAIGFDAASRISSIGANTYGYDSLDRLTSAVLPATNYGYSYDAVGNRLTRTTGAATDTYAYSSTSNRIATITPSSGPVKSFVFDANGSTTDDAANTYAYDSRGRMVQATSSLGVTTYQVNALGQRVRKTNSQADTVFHYDAQGRLIAETDPGGILKREYLYLGDIPVGVIQ